MRSLVAHVMHIDPGMETMQTLETLIKWNAAMDAVWNGIAALATLRLLARTVS